MIVAVSAKGRDLDAEVDPRFGRAQYILIVETSSLGILEVIDNAENVNALKGAGIQAATTISDKGVHALLTGFCGPNAFKTLKAAEIKVGTELSGTVKDAIAAFKEGRISFADKANAEGHA